MAEPVDPLFLSVEAVLLIHDRVSGAEILDLGHLESAAKAVEHFVIYGDWSDLFDIAAAYAFHISEAHAFLDGNKRTALGASLDFLKLNGINTAGYDDWALFEMMMALANHELSREGVASKLRTLLPVRP